MMISKIELKCFQMNLMTEWFMCLRLVLLELLKIKISPIKINILFFQISDPKFLASFLLFTFFFEFALFFPFFLNKNFQVKKI